jgi:hypothetical protein
MLLYILKTNDTFENTFENTFDNTFDNTFSTQKANLGTEVFCLEWFIALFSKTMPTETVLRVFFVRVCVCG